MKKMMELDVIFGGQDEECCAEAEVVECCAELPKPKHLEENQEEEVIASVEC